MATPATPPRGGWINRSTNGAAAAWTEPEPEATPVTAVQFTDRVRLVVERLLPATPRGLPEATTAADVAHATGVAAGTVAAILGRLVNAKWVDSDRVEGERRYRMNAAGVQAAREALGVPQAPAAVEKPAPPAPPAQRRRRIDDGGTYTMAELAKSDPQLAALARQKLAKERANS